MNAHEKWKYIEAVFVPPGIPHPQWPLPIGKQLVGRDLSTLRFLLVLLLIRKRQRADQSVNGTYFWSGDRWELLSETGFVDLPELHCPACLPGDIDVIQTDSGSETEAKEECDDEQPG